MTKPDDNAASRTLNDLTLTEANPRVLTQAASETMDRTIDEFGSLDGIVFNAQLGELVGGNQRTVKFRRDPDARLVIVQRLAAPSPAGTTAVGYVEIAGERWPYREVRWPSAKHRKAVYAANKVHADWDEMLAQEELLAMDEADLLDTGFELAEVQKLQDGWVDHEAPVEEKEVAARRFTKQELRDMAAVHFNNGGPNDINQFIVGLPDDAA